MSENAGAAVTTPRRVLMVCPRFAPSSAPDMHRVRLALPWLPEFGWSATVLCVDPQFVPVPQDPLLVAGIPDDVTIHRTKAIPLKWTRRLGFGSLTVRSLRYLRAEGDKLLRQKSFDLVYFSTTEFGVFCLGPRWLSRYGVPYVLDYQDPWITDYYQKHQISPPGGRLKYRLFQTMAKLREPSIVRQAAHITAVSSTYAEQLCDRYSLPQHAITTLPFGGTSTDFQTVARENVSNPVFQPQDGLQHWLYAGVAGPYMKTAVMAILKAFQLALHIDPHRFERVRMHFVGTDYAIDGQAQARILPIARELGLLQYVHEQTARIPYFQVVRCLMDADALIMPGSDDPGYTASKICPYILARKPLLTVFHEASSVCDIMKSCNSGVLVQFRANAATDEIAAQILKKWFLEKGYERQPSTDWQAFEPYTARHMTKVLAAVFSEAAANGSRHGSSV